MNTLRLIIVSALLVCCQQIWAADNDSVLLAKQGAAILSVRTIGGELPTCSFLWPPEGANGIGLINNNKVPGRVILTEGDSTLYDSGDYVKDQSGMTIKVRGNSSAYYYAKYPYKIKLERKNDLFNRGSETYYDKNWVLLHEGDSKLNAMIGLKVSELMGVGQWTPAYKFVNLILNGDNLGVYMLIEQVRRNRDCRIDVDKTSGYIIERDSYWWNEGFYFKSWLNKEYTFKYPDTEDLTLASFNYIQQEVQTMEQAISNGNYDDVIDTRSFAAWLLAHDILGTYDSGGSNIYLTKYDSSDTTKFAMATLWDFDSSFRNQNKWARIHDSNFFYFPLLFTSDNKSFATQYYKLWEEKRDTLFSQMEQFLNDFLLSDECRKMDYSRILDGHRFNCIQPTVRKNINDALKWFSQRKLWLDTMVSQIETSIETPASEQKPATATYNLKGMREKPTFRGRGLRIVNGRKYFTP